jgi:hypothetical protein
MYDWFTLIRPAEKDQPHLDVFTEPVRTIKTRPHASAIV